MNIETYLIENSSIYINAELFFNDLKNQLITPQYVYNIEKNKTYYSSGLNTPKNRINLVKQKYNLQKVLNADNADYIFLDSNIMYKDVTFHNVYMFVYFNTVKTNDAQFVESINSIFNYTTKNNDRACLFRLENWKKYNTNHAVSQLIDDTLTLAIKIEDAKKIYNTYYRYTINKPFVDLSLLVEEDLPLLHHTDFVSEYLKRLQSSTTSYMTLLTLYSYYNIQSVKILFRKYCNRYDKSSLDTLVRDIKNKDVYTKYILTNITHITTNRDDLKKLYYWTRVKSKFIKGGYMPDQSRAIFIKTKYHLQNTLIKIKAKYIIENEK